MTLSFTKPDSKNKYVESKLSLTHSLLSAESQERKNIIMTFIKKIPLTVSSLKITKTFNRKHFNFFSFWYLR
jgi:hypothetical protein